jgi:hypothetical protein
MKYFCIEPGVAGGLGERTVMDTRVHPPFITKLHYEMEGWLGDVLIESFPVFAITQEAADVLSNAGMTGIRFGAVEVTASDTFSQMYPGRALPAFVWLQPDPDACRSDFGTAPDGQLVVSERALTLLRKLGIANALVAPFE